MEVYSFVIAMLCVLVYIPTLYHEPSFIFKNDRLVLCCYSDCLKGGLIYLLHKIHYTYLVIQKIGWVIITMQ